MAPSVAAFSEWLRAAVADRDESHGHAHFERVRRLTLRLAEAELTAPLRTALPWRRRLGGLVVHLVVAHG